MHNFFTNQTLRLSVSALLLFGFCACGNVEDIPPQERLIGSWRAETIELRYFTGSQPDRTDVIDDPGIFYIFEADSTYRILSLDTAYTGTWQYESVPGDDIIRLDGDTPFQETVFIRELWNNRLSIWGRDAQNVQGLDLQVEYDISFQRR